MGRMDRDQVWKGFVCLTKELRLYPVVNRKPLISGGITITKSTSMVETHNCHQIFNLIVTSSNQGMDASLKAKRTVRSIAFF